MACQRPSGEVVVVVSISNSAASGKTAVGVGDAAGVAEAVAVGIGVTIGVAIVGWATSVVGVRGTGVGGTAVSVERVALTMTASPVGREGVQPMNRNRRVNKRTKR